MEVMSSSSRLNPHAAPFVPWAYRAVEDYSPEWWSMVESSAGFRDYWLRECFHEEDVEVDDVCESALPDADSLFHSYPLYPKEEEVKDRKSGGWELIGWGAEKWHAASGRPLGPKYFEKAPKIVNMKVGPRTIQQPR